MKKLLYINGYRKGLIGLNYKCYHLKTPTIFQYQIMLPEKDSTVFPSLYDLKKGDSQLIVWFTNFGIFLLTLVKYCHQLHHVKTKYTYLTLLYTIGGLNLVWWNKTCLLIRSSHISDHVTCWRSCVYCNIKEISMYTDMPCTRKNGTSIYSIWHWNIFVISYFVLK